MYMSLPVPAGKKAVVVQELIDEFVRAEIMEGTDAWYVNTAAFLLIVLCADVQALPPVQAVPPRFQDTHHLASSTRPPYPTETVYDAERRVLGQVRNARHFPRQRSGSDAVRTQASADGAGRPG
jgi:hypothetical protein